MIGVASLIVMSTALLVVVLLGAPTVPVLVLLLLAVSSLGLIMGNATALASGEVRDLAGTGSALLGALQFGLGAVVSPLVGASATTMAAVMVVASVLAATALVLTRAPARQPVTIG